MSPATNRFTTPVFRPPSLAGLAAAPSFLLRPVDADTSGAVASILAGAGLTFHETDAIRAIALDELKSLWPLRKVSTESARLRRLWMRADAGQKLKPADTEALEDLGERLALASPTFGEMLRDNRAWERRLPDAAAAALIAGWTNLAIAAPTELGPLSLATVAAIGEALDAIEAGAGLPTGRAKAELVMGALGRLQIFRKIGGLA